MKEIIGNKKRFTNAPLPNFITVKNREIFDKTIKHSKTIFTTTVLSTISLTGLGLENAFNLKINKMMIYLPMLSKERPMKCLLF